VPIRSHLWPIAFGIASIALFWTPLHQLVSLSLNDRRYSHLILIPVISAFFFYRERRAIFSRPEFRPTGFRLNAGLPFLALSLVLYVLLALRIVPFPANSALSMLVLSVVLAWISAFALCYGPHTFRAALFPLLLLLLLVPIPFNLMDQIVSLLQRGSAEASYILFRLAGVPMFREGVRFELPGIGIEVAEECSSIHSGWALFITSLLVAHIFLRSIWTKTCLSVLAVPIAMLTNAVRIVAIWFLATKVDVGFMYGNLHRNGGILFSLISLSLLMSLLWLLRKSEGKGSEGRPGGPPNPRSLLKQAAASGGIHIV
jgi:exosortase